MVPLLWVSICYGLSIVLIDEVALVKYAAPEESWCWGTQTEVSQWLLVSSPVLCLVFVP